MARWVLIIFSILTLGTSYLTYSNIGLEETKYTENSVRSGSAGSYGGSGGYRHGK